jgi:preprotein translocase subunit SecF
MFDFSKYKTLSIISSVIAILLLFTVTFMRGGFAHSLDFNGGLRVTAAFPISVEKSAIESFFKTNSIEAVIIRLTDSKEVKKTVNFQIDIALGSVKKIKELNIAKTDIPVKKNDIDQFVELLKSQFSLTSEDILSADQVGAVVGGELTSAGITLLVVTLLVITIYLSFRFQFKYALGASIAVIHDLLFTLAFIGAFQLKPSVPLIAALLTILGYSINDTIVVFDRIRENTSDEFKQSISNIINKSINQTLSRTLMTSGTTLISVVALIIGGAVELYDFAYVLTFGIVVGTYSSIFIAAPVVEFYEDRFGGKESSAPKIKPEVVL